VEGMAFFYFDKMCFNERRFYLSHFSVIDTEKFDVLLVKVLNYFWINVYYI
jgi:hypothetical protein